MNYSKIDVLSEHNYEVTCLKHSTYPNDNKKYATQKRSH